MFMSLMHIHVRQTNLPIGGMLSLGRVMHGLRFAIFTYQFPYCFYSFICSSFTYIFMSKRAHFQPYICIFLLWQFGSKANVPSMQRRISLMQPCVEEGDTLIHMFLHVLFDIIAKMDHIYMYFIWSISSTSFYVGMHYEEILFCRESTFISMM